MAIEKIKHFKAYRYYRKRIKGETTIDCTRGCGYYLIVGMGKDHKGKIDTWKTAKGNVIMKLINYRTYSDPWDMIEESYWQLIGYENCKPISECTFKEFLDIYAKDMNLIK